MSAARATPFRTFSTTGPTLTSAGFYFIDSSKSKIKIKNQSTVETIYFFLPISDFLLFSIIRFCPELQSNRSEKVTHMEEKHSSEMADACEKCGMRFENAKCLRRHIKCVHDVTMVIYREKQEIN